MAVFLPSREVERVRLDLGRSLATVLKFSIDLLDLVLLDVITDLMVAVTGVDHAHVVHHPAILHLAIWRLDKAVVVNARVAAQ